MGRILDQGLAGETAPDKALQLLIEATRLGHKDAKVLVERTKHCVAEQTCDGAEAVGIWTCERRRIRMAPLSDLACDRTDRNPQRVQELIDRRRPVDQVINRYFGDPLPGGRAAGNFASEQECAARAAAGPNEQRRCHQELKWALMLASSATGFEKRSLTSSAWLLRWPIRRPWSSSRPLRCPRGCCSAPRALRIVD